MSLEGSPAFLFSLANVPSLFLSCCFACADLMDMFSFFLFR